MTVDRPSPSPLPSSSSPSSPSSASSSPPSPHTSPPSAPPASSQARWRDRAWVQLLALLVISWLGVVAADLCVGSVTPSQVPLSLPTQHRLDLDEGALVASTGSPVGDARAEGRIAIVQRHVTTEGDWMRTARDRVTVRTPEWPINPAFSTEGAARATLAAAGFPREGLLHQARERYRGAPHDTAIDYEFSGPEDGAFLFASTVIAVGTQLSERCRNLMWTLPIWIGVWFVLRELRAARRLTREVGSRCGECGYLRTTRGPCPECGNPSVRVTRVRAHDRPVVAHGGGAHARGSAADRQR